MELYNPSNRVTFLFCPKHLALRVPGSTQRTALAAVFPHNFWKQVILECSFLVLFILLWACKRCQHGRCNRGKEAPEHTRDVGCKHSSQVGPGDPPPVVGEPVVKEILANFLAADGIPAADEPPVIDEEPARGDENALHGEKPVVVCIPVLDAPEYGNVDEPDEIDAYLERTFNIRD